MKKKVFILGNWNLHYSWFVRTFEQGFLLNDYEVYGMDLRKYQNRIDIIYDYMRELKPAYVFDHMSFRQWPYRQQLFDAFNKIRKEGTKVVHVLGDAYLERYKGDLRDMFDCVLLGKTQNMEKLKKIWKVPIYYCLYSSLVYSHMVRPIKELSYKNLVFTGNPSIHKDRSDFLRRLSNIMSLEVFQTQGSNDKRNLTRELSSSATAILGACTGYDVNGYADVRGHQYLGAGACMIMRKFKNMDDIFPEDIYYPFNSYDDPYVVKELFERASKENTMPMRKKAFEFIQKYHNCKKRIADVVEVIEGRKDKIPQLLEDL